MLRYLRRNATCRIFFNDTKRSLGRIVSICCTVLIFFFHASFLDSPRGHLLKFIHFILLAGRKLRFAINFESWVFKSYLNSAISSQHVSTFIMSGQGLLNTGSVNINNQLSPLTFWQILFNLNSKLKYCTNTGTLLSQHFFSLWNSTSQRVWKTRKSCQRRW
jgi:hypothetical protein